MDFFTPGQTKRMRSFWQLYRGGNKEDYRSPWVPPNTMVISSIRMGEKRIGLLIPLHLSSRRKPSGLPRSLCQTEFHRNHHCFLYTKCCLCVYVKPRFISAKVEEPCCGSCSSIGNNNIRTLRTMPDDYFDPTSRLNFWQPNCFRNMIRLETQKHDAAKEWSERPPWGEILELQSKIAYSDFFCFKYPIFAYFVAMHQKLEFLIAENDCIYITDTITIE